MITNEDENEQSGDEKNIGKDDKEKEGKNFKKQIDEAKFLYHYIQAENM